MVIENIQKDKQAKFYMAIDKNLSSLRKRSISYVISCHDERIASVVISVTGKRGTASRSLVIDWNNLNKQWQVVSMDKRYTLDSLTEIGSIAKSLTVSIATLVNKI